MVSKPRELAVIINDVVGRHEATETADPLVKAAPTPLSALRP